MVLGTGYFAFCLTFTVMNCCRNERMYSRGRQLIQLSRHSQSLPAATDDVFRVPGSGEEQAHKLMISQSWSCI